MPDSCSILHRKYETGWVCALPVEMAAARAMLDVAHDDLPQSAADDNTYVLGEISGHNVVITCLPAGVYGTTMAASVVAQIRSTFPALRFGLLVGVGGGVPTRDADIRLGDVVVSNPVKASSGVVQYDLGKTTHGGNFERVGMLNRPPDVTLAAVSRLQATYLAAGGRISHIMSDALAKNPQLRNKFSRPGSEEDRLFNASYEHSPPLGEVNCANCDEDQLVLRPERPSDGPEIHYGLIASGNQVIKDGLTRDQLASALGILCFEMEAAGVMNKIPALVIRGICDYSDSHKNNNWQGYAALTAAAYAKELLSVIPMSQMPKSAFKTDSKYISRFKSGPSKVNLSPRGHRKELNQDVRVVKITTYYKLGFGRLSVQNIESRTTQTPEAAENEVEEVEITFLPPSWMSNTLFRIRAGRNRAQMVYANPGLEWSIRPVSINQNPRLRNALFKCDIKELKGLFLGNQARPTDLVFDENLNEPISLLDAVLQAFTLHRRPCSSKLHMHRLILQFLLGQKLQPSNQAVNAFFFSASYGWAYDQEHLRRNLVNSSFQIILANGGCSLEPIHIPTRLFLTTGFHFFGYDSDAIHVSILSTLVEKFLGFQAIPGCLFHHSQVWTIEDLSVRSIWYIGILAHTDAKFHASLKNSLSSFRSPFTVASPDVVWMSLFDIGAIVEQVKTSTLTDRITFIQAIIQQGTPQMLDPFLNVGIDFDEGHILDNYLGRAAIYEKWPIFTSLLDAGASPAKAIPLLCMSHTLDATTFRSVFTRLMDSPAETMNKIKITEWDIPNPIVAVLKSTPAMETRPHCVETLLENGAYLPSFLYGSPRIFVSHSYILNAIVYNRPAALKSLLSYGISSDHAIHDIFRTDRKWFQAVGEYTWLTLAVELGRTACVKHLVDSVADPVKSVKLRDARGRSAISLAQSYTTNSHPRVSPLHSLPWIDLTDEDLKAASSSDDAATYDILRATLGSESEEFPGSRSLSTAQKWRCLILIAGLWFKSGWNRLQHISLYKAFYLSLCYIGMYGMVISYGILRFALRLAGRRHMLREQLFWPTICLVLALLCYNLYCF